MPEKRITKKRKETGGIPKAPVVETRMPVAGSGGVTVVSGPMVDTLTDLVGMKVSEATSAIGPTYGAAPGSRILVNGKVVDDGLKLSAGDTLEFVRAAGEKGTLVENTRGEVRIVGIQVKGVQCNEDGTGEFDLHVPATVYKKGRSFKVKIPLVKSQATEKTELMHPRLRSVYPLTRYHVGMHILTIEMPPHTRTIQIGQGWYELPIGAAAPNEYTNEDDEEDNEWVEHNSQARRVHLAFPYVVLVVAIRDRTTYFHGQAFYRTEPLTPTSQELMQTNLMNVSRNAAFDERGMPLRQEETQQHLCIGTWDPKWDAEDKHWTWHATEEVIFRFFGNTFNGSARTNQWNIEQRSLAPEVSTFPKWEDATRKDPSFILRVPWIPALPNLDTATCNVIHNAGTAVPAGSHLPLLRITLENQTLLYRAIQRNTGRE